MRAEEEEKEGECCKNLNMANTILAADSAVRAGISDWLHVTIHNVTIFRTTTST